LSPIYARVYPIKGNNGKSWWQDQNHNGKQIIALKI